MSTKQPLRVALVGWGAIARTVASMLSNANIEIVAVAKRDWSTPGPELPASARSITHPDELGTVQPDVVAEAASRESVGPWGRAALEAGADFIVSSVSAFADNALLESLRTIAEHNNVQIYIQPGALGGVDALSAARKMGIDTVEHRIVKPPRAWAGTPAEDLCALDALAALEVFFDGSAAEAASQFPKNANVAMTTALAGIGPERTRISLVADPAVTTNRHEIVAHGAFGHLEVSISNNPLPDNPKTSAMAALNLVRSIENQTAAIIL